MEKTNSSKKKKSFLGTMAAQLRKTPKKNRLTAADPIDDTTTINPDNPLGPKSCETALTPKTGKQDKTKIKTGKQLETEPSSTTTDKSSQESKENSQNLITTEEDTNNTTIDNIIIDICSSTEKAAANETPAVLIEENQLLKQNLSTASSTSKDLDLQDIAEANDDSRTTHFLNDKPAVPLESEQLHKENMGTATLTPAAKVPAANETPAVLIEENQLLKQNLTTASSTSEEAYKISKDLDLQDVAEANDDSRTTHFLNDKQAVPLESEQLHKENMGTATLTPAAKVPAANETPAVLIEENQLLKQNLSTASFTSKDLDLQDIAEANDDSRTTHFLNDKPAVPLVSEQLHKENMGTATLTPAAKVPAANETPVVLIEENQLLKQNLSTASSTSEEAYKISKDLDLQDVAEANDDSRTTHFLNDKPAVPLESEQLHKENMGTATLTPAAKVPAANETPAVLIEENQLLKQNLSTASSTSKDLDLLDIAEANDDSRTTHFLNDKPAVLLENDQLHKENMGTATLTPAAKVPAANETPAVLIEENQLLKQNLSTASSATKDLDLQDIAEANDDSRTTHFLNDKPAVPLENEQLHKENMGTATLTPAAKVPAANETPAVLIEENQLLKQNLSTASSTSKDLDLQDIAEANDDSRTTHFLNDKPAVPLENEQLHKDNMGTATLTPAAKVPAANETPAVLIEENQLLKQNLSTASSATKDLDLQDIAEANDDSRTTHFLNDKPAVPLENEQLHKENMGTATLTPAAKVPAANETPAVLIEENQLLKQNLSTASSTSKDLDLQDIAEANDDSRTTHFLNDKPAVPLENEQLHKDNMGTATLTPAAKVPAANETPAVLIEENQLLKQNLSTASSTLEEASKISKDLDLQDIAEANDDSRTTHFLNDKPAVPLENEQLHKDNMGTATLIPAAKVPAAKVPAANETPAVLIEENQLLKQNLSTASSTSEEAYKISKDLDLQDVAEANDDSRTTHFLNDKPAVPLENEQLHKDNMGTATLTPAAKVPAANETPAVLIEENQLLKQNLSTASSTSEDLDLQDIAEANDDSRTTHFLNDKPAVPLENEQLHKDNMGTATLTPAAKVPAANETPAVLIEENQLLKQNLSTASSATKDLDLQDIAEANDDSRTTHFLNDKPAVPLENEQLHKENMGTATLTPAAKVPAANETPAVLIEENQLLKQDLSTASSTSKDLDLQDVAEANDDSRTTHFLNDKQAVPLESEQLHKENMGTATLTPAAKVPAANETPAVLIEENQLLKQNLSTASSTSKDLDLQDIAEANDDSRTTHFLNDKPAVPLENEQLHKENMGTATLTPAAKVPAANETPAVLIEENQLLKQNLSTASSTSKDLDLQDIAEANYDSRTTHFLNDKPAVPLENEQLHKENMGTATLTPAAKVPAANETPAVLIEENQLLKQNLSTASSTSEEAYTISKDLDLQDIAEANDDSRTTHFLNDKPAVPLENEQLHKENMGTATLTPAAKVPAANETPAVLIEENQLLKQNLSTASSTSKDLDLQDIAEANDDSRTTHFLNDKPAVPLENEQLHKENMGTATLTPAAKVPAANETPAVLIEENQLLKQNLSTASSTSKDLDLQDIAEANYDSRTTHFLNDKPAVPLENEQLHKENMGTATLTPTAKVPAANETPAVLIEENQLLKQNLSTASSTSEEAYTISKDLDLQDIAEANDDSRTTHFLNDKPAVPLENEQLHKENMGIAKITLAAEVPDISKDNDLNESPTPSISEGFAQSKYEMPCENPRDRLPVILRNATFRSLLNSCPVAQESEQLEPQMANDEKSPKLFIPLSASTPLHSETRMAAENDEHKDPVIELIGKHSHKFLCVNDLVLDYSTEHNLTVPLTKIKSAKAEKTTETTEAPEPQLTENRLLEKGKKPTTTKLMKEGDEKAAIERTLEVHIGARVFHCNISLLKCYAEFFEKLVVDEQIVKLPECVITQAAFATIYKWMVQEEYDIQWEPMLHLYQAAIILRIPDLIVQCWQLWNDEKIIPEHMAFRVFMQAKIFKLQPLQKLMLQRIKRFFLSLVASDEYLELDAETVTALLSENTLGVNNEIEIFLSAVHWLWHDFAARERYKSQIMSAVRFAKLPDWFIGGILCASTGSLMARSINDISIRKQIKEAALYLAQLMYSSVNIHSKIRQSHKPSERLWIYDKNCEYHHRLGCTKERAFGYSDFFDYLQTLQEFGILYWKNIEFAESSIMDCCTRPAVQAPTFSTNPEKLYKWMM